MVLPLLAALVLSAPTPAELNERFARGVRLFDEGRVADALAEFEALEALKPNPTVRFNLAHCHARLGHAVRAVALLEALLAAEVALPTERLAAASRLLAEQRARVGTLEVKADGPVEGVLELDGDSRAATLPATVQVDPGSHNVTFQAAGYLPARRVATVAPGARTEVSLALVRVERPPARVRVLCPLPAVELAVDGAVVAKTPVTGVLLLPAGLHTLTARRPGYAPFSVPLALTEGLEEVVVLELAVEGAPEASLRVRPTEDQAVVTVDGRLARADVPLRLPPGPHAVRVEREGFFPMQQLVEVEREQALEVVLEPTSPTLVALSRQRLGHRIGGWLSVGLGGPLVITGALIWGLNQPTLSNLEGEFQRLSGLCIPANALRCPPATREEFVTKSIYLTQAQWTRLWGVVALSAGVLGAGAGAVLLLTAPDLSRYEQRKSVGPLAPLSLSVSVGVGSVRVDGKF